MNKEQILNEVANSDWQPEFEFTDDLDRVVDAILKPHEDYFLGLHSKVKEIINREIDYFTDYHKQCVSVGEPEQSYYKVTFADMCNWQKELFEHKKRIIADFYNELNEDLSIDGAMRLSTKIRIIEELPNLYLDVENKLGLRNSIVTVGKWTPPHPIYLEDLKEMCFPIKVMQDKTQQVHLGTNWFNVTKREDVKLKQILYHLTEWYKVFETIHFFNDLNGRVGGIVINILSYLLTGKYLINVEYRLNKSISND